LKSAGVFLGVRHQGFKPQLINVAELVEPVSIRLQHLDGTERKLPACNGSHGWIGGGLKIKRANLPRKGPIYGEHTTVFDRKAS
jgi:hypothetical protein